MTKPLSQLLEEIEPKFTAAFFNANKLTSDGYIDVIDRASYDKLKAIAVELAKGLEYIEDPHPQDNVQHLKRTASSCMRRVFYIFYKDATTARKMLGDEF